MTNRKQRLRLIQVSFLITGIFIIFFTYFDKKKDSKEILISKETQEKIETQIKKQTNSGDIFFNIEYSGLDLSGNRYILKSDEAFTDQSNQKIVNMKGVNSVFYFKDGTILTVISNTGIYNNETLDMIFRGGVKAYYEGSELFAQKAEYSNSKSFLVVTEKVKVIDSRGTLKADKLIFDIKNQKLNIASFDNEKINANINLK
jgi:hypothetical protein